MQTRRVCLSGDLKPFCYGNDKLVEFATDNSVMNEVTYSADDFEEAEKHLFVARPTSGDSTPSPNPTIESEQNGNNWCLWYPLS